MLKFKVKRAECIRFRNIESLDDEHMAYISIFFFYMWQTGNLFVQKCFGGSRLLVLGMYLFLVAGVGISLLNTARKRVGYLLLSELVAITLYMLSYIYGYAQMSILLYNLIWTAAICIPISINIMSIRDMAQFKHLLYLMAKPMVLVLCAIIFLEFNVLKTNVGQYDMPASYALIFYCIVLCNAILEKMKIVDVVVLLGGLGMVLLRGSRGTYLCFAFFVVIKVLFDINSKRKKRFLLICGVGVVLIGILFVVMAQIYYSNGVDSELMRFRSLAKLLSGEMFRSDARLQLYSYYLKLIVQKPFLGWGVAGGWIDSGFYPHNFFLEMLVAFGVIPGMFVFLVMLSVLGYILKGGQKSERTLFLIYFSNAFSLIVSGTFLQNISFYFCIFFGVCCMKRRILWNRTRKTIGKNCIQPFIE